MEDLNGQSLLAESGLDFFKSASAFGALTDPAIRFLLERGRVIGLADREVLFRPGEQGSSFFIVLKGRLDYLRESEGVDMVIRSVAFGEQLGYVSMIGLFERLGLGRARGPSMVLEVDAGLFYQLHLEFPFDFGVLLLNLSRDMARTIRTVTANLAEACIGQAIA